jgi:addiction module HigA family antidote
MNRKVQRLRSTHIHPGEILREEFLEPFRMSAAELGRRIHVSSALVRGICNERRAITADTAIRLARFFGNSEQFWMNLQSGYDLRRAQAVAAKDVASIRPLKEQGAA